MTHQLIRRSPATASRKNVPLLEEATKKKKKKTKRVAEVAGGTAADCAAVCCCCPCTVMNLVILAVYKIPARLCSKVIKRHRLRMTQKQSLLLGSSSRGCREELEREVREIVEREKEKINNNENNGEESDAIILEREMWAQFYSSGFWRSPSQRST